MRKSLTIKYNSTRAGSITTAPDKLPTAETAATPQLLCSGGRKDYKQKKKKKKRRRSQLSNNVPAMRWVAWWTWCSLKRHQLGQTAKQLTNNLQP